MTDLLKTGRSERPSARSPLAMLSTHARHSSGFATGNTVTAKVSMSAPPSEARPGVKLSHADHALSIGSDTAVCLPKDFTGSSSFPDWRQIREPEEDR